MSKYSRRRSGGHARRRVASLLSALIRLWWKHTRIKADRRYFDIFITAASQSINNTARPQTRVSPVTKTLPQARSFHFFLPPHKPSLAVSIGPSVLTPLNSSLFVSLFLSTSVHSGLVESTACGVYIGPFSPSSSSPTSLSLASARSSCAEVSQKRR